MKIMLTSFGITRKVPRKHDSLSMFHGMPPVSMHRFKNVFMPEYAALLLSEKLILDKKSYDTLAKKPSHYYLVVSETVKSLQEEGFIELVDFNKILNNNNLLLRRMLQHDLEFANQWIQPLNESMRIWIDFVNRVRAHTDHEYGQLGIPPRDCDHIAVSPKILNPHEWSPSRLHLPRKHYYYSSYLWTLHELRHVSGEPLDFLPEDKTHNYKALRAVLLPYLSYVNANIVLSNELGIGFHDWMDYLPFYRQKFLYVGTEVPKAEFHVMKSQELFRIAFPEFEISNPTSLINALKDRRIENLRQLVHDAVEGKVRFNETFARNVLKDVLKIERQSKRYRRIISYLTMPIGFAPWIGGLARKATEEVIGTILESKLKKKYQWFYLLSDVADDKTEKE